MREVKVQSPKPDFKTPRPVRLPSPLSAPLSPLAPRPPRPNALQ